MGKKLSSSLYRITRIFGKAATTANDIETLSTMDPKKIGNRLVRKVSGRYLHGLVRTLTRR